MLQPFNLIRPLTIEQACDVLADDARDVVAYAGGTEVVPLMKLGFARPDALMDLKTLPGLDAISELPGTGRLALGPLVRHRQLERSTLIAEHWPLIREVESQVANVRVRNTGTVGGNICFADPQSDLATLFLMLGCTLELHSASGSRRLTLDDFILGPYTTALQPAELLVSIELGPLPQDAGVAYERIRLMERPAVSVAARVEQEDGRLTSVAVALGCVEGVPRRLHALEERLVGLELVAARETLPEVGNEAANSARVESDLTAGEDYKRQLVATLTRRALTKALDALPPL